MKEGFLLEALEPGLALVPMPARQPSPEKSHEQS